MHKIGSVVHCQVRVLTFSERHAEYVVPVSAWHSIVQPSGDNLCHPVEDIEIQLGAVNKSCWPPTGEQDLG
jgi:hypothetical protein